MLGLSHLCGEPPMYHGERFNAWTHLVGALLACLGAIWLQALAALGGSLVEMVSVAIYGIAWCCSTASPPSTTACADGRR